MFLPKNHRLSYFRGTVSAIALTAAALLPAHRAAAQQATASGDQKIQEVIVTAEKRSENVQQVPIAVTSFTAQSLQDRAIQDVSAMGALAPSVNLDTASAFGGSHEVLSASIRGIGQDDFSFNLDPGVGVYVDGIYYARTVGANQDLLDVGQVDILKGPQGTLFGRNTIGGAINITTRDPGDTYMAEGVATGGSFGRHDFQVTADLPISDTLLSSITFSTLNQDGYQQRIPYPTSLPYVYDSVHAFHGAGTETFGTLGGTGEDILRGKLVWKAADDLKVTFTGDWTHVDQSAVPESLLDTVTSPTVQGAAFGFFYNACLAGEFIPTVCGPRGPGLNGHGNSPFAGGLSGTSTGNPGLFGSGLNPAALRQFYGNQFITNNPDTTYSTGPDFNTMDSFGGSVTADWSLNPDTDLKSITGYRRLVWAVGVDPDGSPIDINDASFSINQKQVSEELQLNGSLLDGRLKYASGLYYFNENGSEHDYVTLGDGLLQIEGVDNLDTSSYAAYTHVDYELIDNLTLVLGARYSYDNKTISEHQDDLNAFNYKISGLYPVSQLGRQLLGFPNPSDPLDYVPAGTITENFYVFTPTAGLQYQITPDLMTYFTYSKGYKDGGWTTRVTQPVPAIPEFGPEKAETYEVGAKSEWLDHHLIVNLDGFYTNYNGIQLNFQEGISPTIRNAGNADIMGTELDTRWLIGNGFSLGATGGYTYAYYTSLENGINSGQSCIQPYEACITLGSKLPKTPKFKASLSPEYDLPLANDATVRFGVDYTHTSSMFNDAINTSLLRRPETDIVNASVTYVSPDDRYELVAGGTNITDDRYLVTGNQDTAGGLLYGTYNAPAEWYLTLRVKFQAEKASPPTAPVAPTPVEAPPAIPTTPKVEPLRQFQVFFDFDKSDITEAAASVIKAAADAVKAGNIVHLTVTGHTDTVGTAKYNQGLSERRAAAVKAKLVSDGVAGGEITTVGVGKTGLLVPTADGVREPQNRRAVIELQ